MLRLSENLKHQRARCVELAFQDKFLFPNAGVQRLVVKHCSPPCGCCSVARWSANPVGNRPGDQSVRPRGDEKIVARSPTPGTVRVSTDRFFGLPVPVPPQPYPLSEPAAD